MFSWNDVKVSACLIAKVVHDIGDICQKFPRPGDLLNKWLGSISRRASHNLPTETRRSVSSFIERCEMASAIIPNFYLSEHYIDMIQY